MCIINSIVNTLKKCITFEGRANRFEFWMFFLFYVVVLLILGGIGCLVDGSKLGTVWGILSAIVLIVLLVPFISVSVRRLHDLDLSGFWLWYLNPCGLPVIFVVYLLDLDPACNKLIEKIQKIGSPWLGWILTVILYPAGALATLFLLFLYKGKPEPNTFGPAPCCCCKAAEAPITE